MEMEKSKVLIQFLVIFRQFGDVLSFLYARRLRGYTATASHAPIHPRTLTPGSTTTHCSACSRRDTKKPVVTNTESNVPNARHSNQ